LIESNRTFAYDFRDEQQDTPHYWRDVGTLDSYYDANMDLLQCRALFDPYIKESWRWTFLQSAKIGAGVDGTSHVSQSVLSPGVRIEPHASVEGCVLMPNVRIGRGARLRKAIVEDGVTVPTGFQAGFDLESDRKRFTVTPGGVVVICEPATCERPTPKWAERVVMFRTSSGDRHESTPVDDHQHSLQLFRP
jgi:glucose-1-phosphate adenylyltransferase